MTVFGVRALGWYCENTSNVWFWIPAGQQWFHFHFCVYLGYWLTRVFFTWQMLALWRSSIEQQQVLWLLVLSKLWFEIHLCSSKLWYLWMVNVNIPALPLSFTVQVVYDLLLFFISMLSDYESMEDNLRYFLFIQTLGQCKYFRTYFINTCLSVITVCIRFRLSTL